MNILTVTALFLIIIAIICIANCIYSMLEPTQQEYEHKYAERYVQHLLHIANAEMNEREHVCNAASHDPSGLVQQHNRQGAWSLLVGR